MVTGSFRPAARVRRRHAVRLQQRAGDLPGAPAYPANYLGVLNMSTGQIAR